MPQSKPFDQPMEVTVIEDQIVILGPDAIGVSITPAAAEESARRLIAAAEKIKGGYIGPGQDD